MSPVNLLIPGNSKLGKDIWHFSIPAIKTCPGRSSHCEKLCYATKGMYHMPSVKTASAIREKARHRADFVATINEEIVRNNIQTLRIHVSGDFDSVTYANKWLKIIRMNSDVKFFFYTRSWRDKKYHNVIRRMAACDNVNAWLSCDKETGRPTINSKNCTFAYMALSDTDKPRYKTHMVFRVSRPTKVVRWTNGSTVCPVERTPSIQVNHDKLNCSSCKLCHGDKQQWLRNYSHGQLAVLS